MRGIPGHGKNDLEWTTAAFIRYFCEKFPDITAKQCPEYLVHKTGTFDGADTWRVGCLKWRLEYEIPNLLQKTEYGRVRDVLSEVRGAMHGAGLASWERIRRIDAEIRVEA